MSGENQNQKLEIGRDMPIPANEMERLMMLNELELDYSELDQTFADLTTLAAKIAGTSISMINLIDTFTQWSVAPFGVEIRQLPREETMCQYTILAENAEGMEVADLSADERFKDLSYVAGSPSMRYYFGLPLKLASNVHIGTLCMLDGNHKNISAAKKEMLAIIAAEIVNRIKIHHAMGVLKRQVKESNAAKNKVAHDIRGPIGGIVGLAEIIQYQCINHKLDEVPHYVDLIHKSGKSVLDLTDEILSAHHDTLGANIYPEDHEFTLATLRTKILDLCGPQAITKEVELSVENSSVHYEIPIPKTNILQILGNLISNSIKFTPVGGTVEVTLDLDVLERQKELKIKVKDSGVGMSPEKIAEILNGIASSSEGTAGEKGYGFGLNLVHQLVRKLKGQMMINSIPGQGTEFELILLFP